MIKDWSDKVYEISDVAHFEHTWMTKRQSLTVSKETIKLHDVNSLHGPVSFITHVGPTWFRVDQAND